METDRLVRKAGKTFTTWRPWLSIKPSANLAGLLALPCRIAEFSCVPPHNEEEKTVDPDELSTTNTKLLNNYFWQMVIYIYILCVCAAIWVLSTSSPRTSNPPDSVWWGWQTFLPAATRPWAPMKNSGVLMSKWQFNGIMGCFIGFYGDVVRVAQEKIVYFNRN